MENDREDRVKTTDLNKQVPVQNPPDLLPDTMINATLWETTGQLPVKEQIKKRKWTWIGHILRRSETCIARQELGWNPQGSRRRGRPQNTWKREKERTIQLKGYTWNQIEQLARDRGGWRRFICGLCSETE